MSIIELALVAVGLSMDAFAVAICKGLQMRKFNVGYALLIALFFGGFQALMPFIGWLLGTQFQALIQGFDHWVAFVLLGFIGGKMIWESRGDDGKDDKTSVLDIKELFILSIATSIDALAVGITIALLPDTDIGFSCMFIGLTTFVISVAGVCIGSGGGSRFRSKAELAGGVILILIGIKILLEHLGIISF